MERLVKTAMFRHLNENNLITQHQHGFLPRKSCVTNLLETADLISEAFDRGFGIDTIYLDYAKAFDKLTHRALLVKLQAYWLKGRLLEWLRCFIYDRQQWVVIDLGVLMATDLSWNDQTSKAANRANSMLGRLKRAIKYWTPWTFNVLYKSYIRPLLEYASPVCSPFRKAEKSELERVQRRATKMIPWLRN